MPKEIKPKAYSPTDTDEIKAINTFKQCIDPKYVKVDIRERDKVPNVDGYLELVTEEQVPMGKIEVQIKKIPKDSISFSCDLSLFSYAESSTSLPVIIICVDVDNKIVYWKHIKRDMIIGKKSQQTITIHFSKPEDEVDPGLLYLSKWTSITNEYLQRIQKFEAIKGQLEEVSKYVVPLKGKNVEEIAVLQSFVDELNRLLDFEFKKVKEIFFKDIWKIGIAIHSFSKERIAYSLFSVKKGYPDTLIKYIDLSSAEIFKNGPYGFLSAWGENDIAVDPKRAARKIIQPQLEDILNKRLLSIKNEFLCNEYLFDFIDEHLVSLGLVEKDSYLTKELQFALHVYLPIWCFVSLTYIKYPKHLQHVDPNMIKMLLGSGDRIDVHKKTLEIIKNNTPIPPFLIGGLFFNFKNVYESLEFFVEKNIKEIKRPYKKRDMTLIASRPTRFVWDGYKQADLDYNANLIFNNFETVYNDFLVINEFNVPDLQLFNNKDYDKVIYAYELRENYREKETPGLFTYYFKFIEGEKGPNKVTCLRADNIKFKPSFDDVIEFENGKYKLVGWSNSIASFFFRRTPMLKLIYETLKDKISKYIRR